MNRHIYHGRRGLTMIEMVFAMTILFLVGSFVMSMFVTGSRQMAMASQNQDLATVTRTKLTEIQSMPFANLNSLPTTPTALPAPHNDFRYSVSFSAFNGEDINTSKQVELTVTHPTFGSKVVRTVRTLLPPPNPGKDAFDKFGCAACHSIPSAGYPDAPGFIPLEPIGALNNGVTRPGPWEDYIAESISDPNAFDPFPAGGTTGLEDDAMLDFSVEGEATYDPNYGISAQELDDMAAWIATFQP